jgi:hypothetical protein
MLAAAQRKLMAIEEMEDLEASIFFRDKLEITINSQELCRIHIFHILDICFRIA